MIDEHWTEKGVDPPSLQDIAWAVKYETDARPRLADKVQTLASLEGELKAGGGPDVRATYNRVAENVVERLEELGEDRLARRLSSRVMVHGGADDFDFSDKGGWMM